MEEQSKRLVELIDKATDPSRGWMKKARLVKMRARWDKIKYGRPLERCYVCNAKATAFHHVVPISRRGSYHWKNVVPICFSCHATIHPWLHPAHPKIPGDTFHST